MCYLCEAPNAPLVERLDRIAGFDEHYTVDFIKAHLLRADQRAMLTERDLSVEDCLNGRYGGEQEAAVAKMYEDWNAQLGAHRFGF